jgi:hypothetical protein
LKPYGFALGGGQALQAHEIIDRPSNDLDNYSTSQDPDVFAAAERDLVEALREHGLTATVVRRDSWFRQIVVTDSGTGEQVGLDLGYDYRKKPPVFVSGLGQVLDIEDVVTGKIRALVDRQAERDYVDIDAILSTGRWSTADLFTIIHEIRPELTEAGFLDILASAHDGDPDEYAALGLNPTDTFRLFDRLRRAVQQHRAQTSSANPPQPPSVSAQGSRSRTAKCSVCGRPLTSKDSITRGYGPSCAKKLQ